MPIKDYPPHLQQAVLDILARCFLQNGNLPNKQDFASCGLESAIDQLLELKWITKTPGRWSESYQPGPELREIIQRKGGL